MDKEKKLPIKKWPEEHLLAATLLVESIVGDPTCLKVFGEIQNKGNKLNTRIDLSDDKEEIFKIVLMAHVKRETGVNGNNHVSLGKPKPDPNEVLLFDRKKYLSSLKNQK